MRLPSRCGKSDVGGVGIPLFAGLVRCCEGGGGVDGLIRGVGDEVDVGVGEFAADEADDFFSVIVGGCEFEVGVADACRGLWLARRCWGRQ